MGKWKTIIGKYQSALLAMVPKEVYFHLWKSQITINKRFGLRISGI